MGPFLCPCGSCGYLWGTCALGWWVVGLHLDVGTLIVGYIPHIHEWKGILSLERGKCEAGTRRRYLRKRRGVLCVGMWSLKTTGLCILLGGCA